MNVVGIALAVYGRVGGMERFNQRVVRCLGELACAGEDQSRVVALWDRPEDAARAPTGVRLHPGESRKMSTAVEFLRAVRAARPTVILYGHVLLTPLAVPARWLAPKARHVLFAHGMEVWGEPPFRHIPAWERRLVRTRIDRIAAVSRFTAMRMAAAYRLPLDRFRLLPNAVDDAGTPAAQPAAGATVLAVTRLEPDERTKGVDVLVRAMPAVCAAVPDAQLMVVGDGPLRPELEGLATSLGLGSRVAFTGFLPDDALQRAYAASAVFALPSRQEGFGIVFLEAWRHGLPVVAGDQDAGAEIVAAGGGGHAVDPSSPAVVAQAIISLLRDPVARHRMGEAGRAAVVDRYTHDRFRTRMADLLYDRLPPLSK